MMTKVMKAWTVGIGGSAQTNLMGELDEGPAQAPLGHTDTAFGEKKAGAIGIGTQAIAVGRIATQHTPCRIMNGHESRLPELASPNR